MDLAARVDPVSSCRLWIQRLLRGSRQRAFWEMLRLCPSPTAAPHLPSVTIRTFFLLVLLPPVPLFHLLPQIMIIVLMIIMKIMIISTVINVCIRNSYNSSDDVSRCNTLCCVVNTFIV